MRILSLISAIVLIIFRAGTGNSFHLEITPDFGFSIHLEYL
ncbi:hypothetical protein M595_5582 [Lyngbya aestuarii BL J]|uniref:Uncharacterized protein n=1 Tax=Lyngbya aestuarii BL J TaxID=1348334 RepID=U7QBC2_9CYAN|nr:hypothetical protein M595_5582 [Lyngbya aestuarii BL J]